MRPRRQRGANRSGSTTAEERRQASAGSCAPSAPACRALVSAASSAFLSAASACGVAHAASRAAEGSARTADVQALSAAASSSDLTPAAAAAALPLPFAPVRARLAAGPSPGGPMMSPGHSARAATCENDEDYSERGDNRQDRPGCWPGAPRAPQAPAAADWGSVSACSICIPPGRSGQPRCAGSNHMATFFFLRGKCSRTKGLAPPPTACGTPPTKHRHALFSAARQGEACVHRPRCGHKGTEKRREAKMLPRHSLCIAGAPCAARGPASPRDALRLRLAARVRPGGARRRRGRAAGERPGEGGRSAAHARRGAAGRRGG